MSKPKAHVFVVDDDASVRTSIANLLESEDYEFDIFASAAEYLTRSPHTGPSCLILDVHLPGLDGLQLQELLRKKEQPEQIVFITGHGDVPMGVRAMKQGAVDFLQKPFSAEALLESVALALKRSDTAWRKNTEVLEIHARIATLTPREKEVFLLVITGMLNKQIADQLGAALRTIKTHRGRVMEKMGVLSLAELVRLAHAAGIKP